MIYMLFDNPKDKKAMRFLKSEIYETSKIQQEYPQHKCNSIKKMIKACLHGIKISNDGDTLVCWLVFMGVLCWWLCCLKRKKRKIVILNILLKEKNTLRNKTARFLYRKALQADNVQATVTSKEYGAWVNRLLGINRKYELLHDIYQERYETKNAGQTDPQSVFCGGRNGRDWEFFFQLAEKMPQIQFYCVLTGEKFRQYQSRFGNNVHAKCDTTKKEFLEQMCKASLVVMPLETEAPAGLIVLYQAAANEKPVLISNTVTTREYFQKDNGIFCENTLEDWQKKITYYLEHKWEAEQKAAKWKQYLETECSEQKYAETLWRILNQ